MGQERDFPTFDQMYQATLWKALVKGGSTQGAASLMGVAVRTVQRWKTTYGIYWDRDYQKYINPNDNGQQESIEPGHGADDYTYPGHA